MVLWRESGGRDDVGQVRLMSEQRADDVRNVNNTNI